MSTINRKNVENVEKIEGEREEYGEIKGNNPKLDSFAGVIHMIHWERKG